MFCLPYGTFTPYTSYILVCRRSTKRVNGAKVAESVVTHKAATAKETDCTGLATMVSMLNIGNYLDDVGSKLDDDNRRDAVDVQEEGNPDTLFDSIITNTYA
jgi:hypothetical protein